MHHSDISPPKKPRMNRKKDVAWSEKLWFVSPHVARTIKTWTKHNYEPSTNVCPRRNTKHSFPFAGQRCLTINHVFLAEHIYRKKWRFRYGEAKAAGECGGQIQTSECGGILKAHNKYMNPLCNYYSWFCWRDQQNRPCTHYTSKMVSRHVKCKRFSSFPILPRWKCDLEPSLELLISVWRLKRRRGRNVSQQNKALWL